jgi:hypothetical protein
MDNSYKSFDIYSEVVINKKVFKIKKMNLGELIEFMTNYRIFVSLEHLGKINTKFLDKKLQKEALNECIKLSVIQKPLFINLKTICTLIEEVLKFNSSPEEKEEKDQVFNNDYLQVVIHEIALQYHWSKEQILKLYPEEIKIYFAKINEHLDNKVKKDALFMIDLEAIITCPQLTKDGFSKYMNDYQRRRDNIIKGIKLEKLDIENFKKKQAEWLATQGVH